MASFPNFGTNLAQFHYVVVNQKANKKYVVIAKFVASFEYFKRTTKTETHYER